MKNIIIAIIIIIAGLGIYFISKNFSNKTEVVNNTNTVSNEVATTTVDQNIGPEEVLGKSVESRDIMAYHYGSGEKELLFVGGIHGGYEWNTSLVAYELMDYLEANPSVIPSSLKITVVPVLNPDGLNKVVGKSGRFTSSDVPASANTTEGRFNANKVDLNRNFDCDWQPSATWQSKTVSGGSSAFSEPESQAIKNYVEKNKPTAVVVWYSSAGGVFSSNCHSGILPETKVITNTYASASGYKAYEEFNFYEITGDMVNWLAKIKVPAISVLLTDHTNTEWSKNQKGILALIKHYSN